MKIIKGTTNEKFEQFLFLLKISYEQIIEILNTVVSGDILIVDTNINYYYTAFLEIIDKILQKNGFEDLKKEAPELYQSLIGNLQDMEFSWSDLLSSKAYNFLNKIEKKYLSIGSPIYNLPEEYKKLFEETNKTITSYKNGKEIEEKSMTENMEKIKNQVTLNNKENNENTETKNKYWISYTKNRNIILNNKYIINTMQFERISDCWFDYIFNNPNRNITLEEIERETKKISKKNYNFNKFLDNIKFKGQIRKLFFKQGNCKIIFYNPITEKDFKERISINVKKLEQEISKLKKIK